MSKGFVGTNGWLPGHSIEKGAPKGRALPEEAGSASLNEAEHQFEHLLNNGWDQTKKNRRQSSLGAVSSRHRSMQNSIKMGRDFRKAKPDKVEGRIGDWRNGGLQKVSSLEVSPGGEAEGRKRVGERGRNPRKRANWGRPGDGLLWPEKSESKKKVQRSGPLHRRDKSETSRTTS